MDREAIEEAIEVLEDASADMLIETGDKNYYVEAIAVLRQALVKPEQKSDPSAWHGWVLREVLFDNGEPIGHREPEQEPVAWANSFDLQNFDMKVRTGPDLNHTVPLYTAPPKKQLVGLTGEEISIIWRDIDGSEGMLMRFARAIEAKLKEKNT